jgi:hypothetical protein
MGSCLVLWMARLRGPFGFAIRISNRKYSSSAASGTSAVASFIFGARRREGLPAFFGSRLVPRDLRADRHGAGKSRTNRNLRQRLRALTWQRRRSDDGYPDLIGGMICHHVPKECARPHMRAGRLASICRSAISIEPLSMSFGQSGPR